MPPNLERIDAGTDTLKLADVDLSVQKSNGQSTTELFFNPARALETVGAENG